MVMPVQAGADAVGEGCGDGPLTLLGDIRCLQIVQIIGGADRIAICHGKTHFIEQQGILRPVFV